MKKILILLVALCCVSVTFGQEQKKVAVYVTGATEEGVNEFVGAYLVDAIANSSNYVAVERTADFLNELTKEQSYQKSGAVDDNQISALGKQFGVSLVCVAKVGKMGEKQFVSARMIDVETATVKSSTKPVIFTLDDVDKSCAAVAVSLISGEPVDIKRPAIADNSQSSNSSQNTNTALARPAPQEGEISFYFEGYQPKNKDHEDNIIIVYLDKEQIGSGTLKTGFSITLKDPNPGKHKLTFGAKRAGEVTSYKIDTSKKTSYEFMCNAWKYLGVPFYSIIMK
jgi:hypothetical protein